MRLLKILIVPVSRALLKFRIGGLRGGLQAHAAIATKLFVVVNEEFHRWMGISVNGALDGVEHLLGRDVFGCRKDGSP